MILIGIVGGIASGKSVVTEQLQRLGAEVLDADRLGHEVLEYPEVQAAIRQRWGEEVFQPDGRVDCAKLARIVFAPPPTDKSVQTPSRPCLHEAGETRSRGSDPFFQQAPGELAYLEQLTHPHIGRCLRERIVELSRAGVRATVLDAAVMLKAGWDDACDRILFVDAPRDLRVARARQRGWSEAEFAAREAAQESLDDKRSRADVVVDNSSTLENTCAQVERFWRSLFPFR